jgi:hypothetical protein
MRPIPTVLQEIQRVRLDLILPASCPCCERDFVWGWIDEELLIPVASDGAIRMLRIPRPDQTVFCPGCEAQILN